VELRQRQPRIKDEGHRRRVGRLSCCVCGKSPVDTAHIRHSGEAGGKQNPGMGRKPDDTFLVPLCREHHSEQHKIGERKFWKKYEINPLIVAKWLYRYSRSHAVCERIVEVTWRKLWQHQMEELLRDFPLPDPFVQLPRPETMQEKYLRLSKELNDHLNSTRKQKL
jgi:hypothetical protein